VQPQHASARARTIAADKWLGRIPSVTVKPPTKTLYHKDGLLVIRFDIDPHSCDARFGAGHQSWLKECSLTPKADIAKGEHHVR